MPHHAGLSPLVFVCCAAFRAASFRHRVRDRQLLAAVLASSVLAVSPSAAQTPARCERLQNQRDIPPPPRPTLWSSGMSLQPSPTMPDVYVSGSVRWGQPAFTPAPECYAKDLDCEFGKYPERREQLLRNFAETMSRSLGLVDVQFHHERSGRCFVVRTSGQDPDYDFQNHSYGGSRVLGLPSFSFGQGEFAIHSIPTGTYRVLVDHPPYRRLSVRLRINSHRAVWEQREKNGYYPARGNHEVLEGMRKPGPTTDGIDVAWTFPKGGTRMVYDPDNRWTDTLSLHLQLPVDSTIDANTLTVRADDPFSLSSSLPASTTRLSGNVIAESPIAASGRTLQSAIPLVPGIKITESTGTLAQFTAIGARRSENRLLIDGAAADLSIAVATPGIGGEEGSQALPALSTTGSTLSLVPAEAVEEIEIRTTTTPARHAQSSGAQMIVTTKAGSNEVHGAAFVDGRAFGASERSFLSGGQRPAASSTNGGGALGGPIVRGRAFFFGVGEYQRIERPFVFTPQVLSAAARERSSPAVRPIVEAFGLPVDGTTGQLADLPQQSHIAVASARLDANFFAMHRVFARINSGRSRGDAYIPQSAPSVDSTEQTTTDTLTAGFSSLLPIGLVNELRVNVSSHRGQLAHDLPIGASEALGLDGSRWARLNIMPSAGGFLIGGVTADASQEQMQVTNNLTVLRGRHELRAGIDLSRSIARRAGTPRRDTYNFADVDQFLSGHVRQVLSERIEPAAVEFRNLAAYAEHTVRIGKRLSANVGVRYSVAPAPVSRTEIDPVFLNFNALPAFEEMPQGSRAWKTRPNVAPRAGLAYRLRQSGRFGSAVSASWSRVADELSRPGAAAYGRGFPYLTRAIFRPSTFPAAAAELALPEHSALLADYYSFDDDLRAPQTQQWYIGVDQEIARAGRVKLAYVRSRARQLVYAQQFAPVAAVPYAVNIYSNAGCSAYQGLLLDYARPFSRGLSVSGSYSWSSARDTDSANTPVPNPAHWLIAPDASYGPADFDRPHVARFEASYLSRASRRLLAGWQLSAAARLQSGAPINVSVLKLLPGDQVARHLRPDVVPDVPQWLDDPSVPTGRRLNPPAFTPSTLHQHGTLTRNSLRAAPLRQVDIALSRSLTLHGALRFDLRVTAYNVFNLANYGPPAYVVIGDSRFGVVDRSAAEAFGLGTLSSGGLTPVQQQGGARALQFGARLTW